jgi:hypothetical protein
LRLKEIAAIRIMLVLIIGKRRRRRESVAWNYSSIVFLIKEGIQLIPKMSIFVLLA